MRDNQLPVHYTSAEENLVRPADNSVDGDVHSPLALVPHVQARPVGNYRADDLSNTVHITLAETVSKPGSGTKLALSPIFFNDEATQNVTPMRGAEPLTQISAVVPASVAAAVAVAPQSLPGPNNQYVAWLLASAIIFEATLYTKCNPTWVSGFVAQTAKISKMLTADSKRRASTPHGGTAVTDTAKSGAGTVAGAAGIHGALTDRNSASAVQPKSETAIYGVTRNSVVRDVLPDAPASLKDVDRSAEHHGSSSGAHRTLASNRDETGTDDFSRWLIHNSNHNASSNAGDSGSSGGMLPALSLQSKPITNNPMDFMNQGFNKGFTFPATELPKAAQAKTSKSKKGFLVPPPPPTPCVLPAGFGFFPMQPAQLHAAPQQQLQKAQAQASPTTHNQVADQENTPQQSIAASGKTDATQSAALVDADQELQAALSSSHLTVSKWTR